jgi:hypothetical protein
MQLVQIRKAQSRMDVVLHVPRPELDPMRYHFMDWAGNAKIGFRRVVIAPLKWSDPGDPVPLGCFGVVPSGVADWRSAKQDKKHNWISRCIIYFELKLRDEGTFSCNNLNARKLRMSSEKH